MATILNVQNRDERFYVVHPLDDAPEEKRSPDNLGPMTMTKSVRYSLFALRGYLVTMGALVLYHVLCLSGVFGHAAH